MLKESQVYNHWDIVYSCFVPDEMLSEHRLPIHALIYVYSGEMIVEDEGRTLTVGAGSYVFLKRDHQVKLLKHTADGVPYKAISIRFERGFLRDFFSRLDKAALPSDVRRIREAAIVLPQSPALQEAYPRGRHRAAPVARPAKPVPLALPLHGRECQAQR